MATLLSGLSNNPVVNVREKEGTYFVGFLKSGARIVRMKKGSGKVYEFSLLDTNGSVQKKGADGKYVEVDVQQGDIVAVFAPTALAGSLDKAKVGDPIRSTYEGTKLNKQGTEFHSFKVEVLTPQEVQAYAAS